MQFKILIIAAVATTVAADGVPYMMASKPLGLAALAARQEPGYQPEQVLCGDGSTCAEACGPGFAQCPSTSDLSSCYNKDAGETCCTDPSGNACEAGFYCAAHTTGDTWCCPDGMSTDDCAANYLLGGTLQAIASPSDSTSPTVNLDSSSDSTAATTSSPQATDEEENGGDGLPGAGRFATAGAIAAIAAAAALL